MNRLAAHEDPMSTFRRVHFIGIGGSGLSAIARLLVESGFSVSGSDRVFSPMAHELAALGVRVDLFDTLKL